MNLQPITQLTPCRMCRKVTVTFTDYLHVLLGYRGISGPLCDGCKSDLAAMPEYVLAEMRIAQKVANALTNSSVAEVLKDVRQFIDNFQP